MSFLRHKQIYRPMLLTSKRDSFATVPLSSSDESATGYSSASCTPALLASASPDDSHGERRSRNCKPPLGRGWGIFIWRFGEFSFGVDTFWPSTKMAFGDPDDAATWCVSASPREMSAKGL